MQDADARAEAVASRYTGRLSFPSCPLSRPAVDHHSMRPTRTECGRLPTSLKLPRVPVMRPNDDSVATLYTRLGSVKLNRVNGLLKSHRAMNFTRSFRIQALERETCAHIKPGAVSVLRPRVPVVNGAGYAKAAALMYGFCRLVGSRLGPIVQ